VDDCSVVAAQEVSNSAESAYTDFFIYFLLCTDRGVRSASSWGASAPISPNLSRGRCETQDRWSLVHRHCKKKPDLEAGLPPERSANSPEASVKITGDWVAEAARSNDINSRTCGAMSNAMS
jgi:hypothetical protein